MMLPGIIGILGPEGSGKTCFMTALCLRLHLGGSRVFAFPGYELKYRGKVISETILPEDWVNLPQALNNIIVAIDEANTFFDSLRFQESTAQMFTYLSAQRRKRNMSIIYTVQDWSWFNNRLRWLTHILCNCWDLYWTYRGSDHPIPRGEQLAITPIDVKGFYTGRPWTRGPTKILHAKHLWDNYDTLATVDAINNMVRVKRNRREIEIGPDGQIIPAGADSVPPVNMEAIERLAGQYLPDNVVTGDPAFNAIVEIVGKIKEKGVTRMPAEVLQEAIRAQGMNISNVAIGRYLKRLRVIFKGGSRGNENVYEFQ